MANQGSTSRQRLTPRPAGYFERSQQPLHSLIFLLPLIILYEVGLGLMHKSAVASGQEAIDVRAHLILNHFFEIFGVTGVYLPGFIVIVVLFCWHMARKPGRDDWRITPGLYPLMGVECLALAGSMLIWAMLFLRLKEPAVAALLAGVVPGAIPGAGAGVELTQNLLISIGAGIYEELLFRLMGIALLHMIFVDLLALPHRVGAAAAVAISALAFSLYHFPSLSFGQWTTGDWAQCVFYTFGGVFLALVYILRGFGIAAGTHALYNVLITLLYYAVRS